MRLSKTSWLVLGIGILFIIFVGLGIVRFQQFQSHKQLRGEITLAEKVLNELHVEEFASRRSELEDRLVHAESQYAVVKAVLSQPINYVVASSIWFDLAEAYNLEVTEMSSTGTLKDTLAGIDCTALSITARVEGEVGNLVDFIVRLNNQLATDFIRSVTITIPDQGSPEKAAADIHLVIYTYQDS